MKNKKLAILPLLLFTPLLMANSPAPVVRPETYNDFSTTFISKEKAPQYGSDQWKYTFEVFNTGKGYITSTFIEADPVYGGLYDYGDDSQRYDEIVIAPGKSAVLSFTSSFEKDFTTDEYKATCSAYQDFVDEAFTSDRKEIRLDDSHEGVYHYYLSFDTSVDLDKREYEYGLIVEVIYKGETRYTHCDLNSTNETHLLYSKEKLDMDELTIGEMVMTKGPRYKSKIGPLFNAIAIILIVGAAILVSGVLFVIIFFSIRAARNKKRS